MKMGVGCFLPAKIGEAFASESDSDREILEVERVQVAQVPEAVPVPCASRVMQR